MDLVGLNILLKEIEVDCGVIRQAATRAGARLLDSGDGRLEACAYHSGLRPAFIPKDGVSSIRELKGFRHVVRHAYDLEFREPRMHELVKLAADLAGKLPGWAVDFGERVRLEQGWD